MHRFPGSTLSSPVTSRRQRVFVAVVCGALLLATACGQGERKVAEEERGVPTTVPRDQQLYREARETFTLWTTLFGASPEYSRAYSILSSATLGELRRRGVRNADAFAAWFSGLRQRGQSPFAYTFSRFDLIDIDVTDTTKAIITATFLVDVHQAQVESVGSFFLKRERGRWVVPFADSGDMVSSWWQKERNFARVLQEKGFSTMYSAGLSLELDYPTTWDAAEQQSLHIPTLQGSYRGIELSYLNPSSLERQAVMRVIVVPAHLPDSLAADSSRQLRPLPAVPTGATPEYRFPGRLTRIPDPSGKREIIVFSAVEDSSGYAQYQSAFNSIIRSITPTASTNDSTLFP